MMTNSLINKAQTLIPTLYTSQISPIGLVDIVQDPNAHLGYRAQGGQYTDQILSQGDAIILDFGNHYVGTFRFHIDCVRNPPDAPLKLKVTFAEVAYELACDFSTYTGDLCSSWFQEEIVFADIMPSVYKIERRHAFRYAKVEVLAKSSRYDAVFSDFKIHAVTSANEQNLAPLPKDFDPTLAKIDQISAQTLKSCMQTVYEDGPKRDRRLWVGDLRLQALTDYYLFKNYDLAKRCLYLFAGLVHEDKRVACCIFERPTPRADKDMLTDYSLMFNVTLFDYFEATHDVEGAMALFPTAMEQVNAIKNELNQEGIVTKQDGWWAFIDWSDALQKTTSIQGIAIYAIDRTAELAKQLGLNQEFSALSKLADHMRKAALEHLFDGEKNLFVNKYDSYQVSVASQVWMILADVVDQEQGIQIIKAMENHQHIIRPVTPYMHHYYVDALFHLGLAQDAAQHIKAYWGGMADKGADTFWEVYQPGDEALSPYNSVMINSFCHAWSCTPSYFIRKYLLK